MVLKILSFFNLRFQCLPNFAYTFYAYVHTEQYKMNTSFIYSYYAECLVIRPPVQFKNGRFIILFVQNKKTT